LTKETKPVAEPIAFEGEDHSINMDTAGYDVTLLKGTGLRVALSDENKLSVEHPSDGATLRFAKVYTLVYHEGTGWEWEQ
jgi:hypothetical protein